MKYYEMRPLDRYKITIHNGPKSEILEGIYSRMDDNSHVVFAVKDGNNVSKGIRRIPIEFIMTVEPVN